MASGDDDTGPVSTDPTKRDGAVIVKLNWVWVYDWIMAAFERHLDRED